MPRKISPKYGIDPVQEVLTFSFTDAQIERLFKTLAPVKGDREQIIADLVSCARDYRWLRNQNREKPTRAEQNAALKDVGQLARNLEMRLRNLDMDTAWELLINLRWIHKENPTDPIMDLTDRLVDSAQAAEQALRIGKEKSGPRSRTHVQRTVVKLANLYEGFTGKHFSHNPKQKTNYTGKPHSRGGQFIIAFFEIVDPNVRHTSLSTAMASFVKSRRSAREPTIS
jgi:hypothetical protein